MKDNWTRTNGMCNGRKVYGWTKLAMERSLKTTGSKSENPLTGYPGGGYPLPDGLYDLLSEDMLPHSQSWWTRAWRGDRATRSNHPVHTQSNSFEGLFKSWLKVGQGIIMRLADAACIRDGLEMCVLLVDVKIRGGGRVVEMLKTRLFLNHEWRCTTKLAFAQVVSL